MKKNSKPSASLPIGSYAWALARLSEIGNDPYALKIKLLHDLPRKQPSGKKHKI